jgi:hypothetical protein
MLANGDTSGTEQIGWVNLLRRQSDNRQAMSSSTKPSTFRVHSIGHSKEQTIHQNPVDCAL